MIGFELCDNQENVENQLYKMTKESYLGNSARLRKAFYDVSGKEPIQVFVEEMDYAKGFGQFIEQYFDNKYLIKKEQKDNGTEYLFDVGKEFES